MNNSDSRFPRIYLTNMRRKLNKSVEVIADEIEVSPSYYFQLEAGLRGNKLTVLLLYKIALVLDVDIGMLVNEEIKYLKSKN